MSGYGPFGGLMYDDLLVSMCVALHNDFES